MEFESLDGYCLVHANSKTCHSATLRDRRLVLGMTQKQVAEKAEIPLVSYQRFESGERNIRTASFQLACRVIEALEMNVSDFYHNEYIFGEEIYATKEGLRFKKTGRLVTEDITEDSNK